MPWRRVISRSLGRKPSTGWVRPAAVDTGSIMTEASFPACSSISLSAASASLNGSTRTWSLAPAFNPSDPGTGRGLSWGPRPGPDRNGVADQSLIVDAVVSPLELGGPAPAGGGAGGAKGSLGPLRFPSCRSGLFPVPACAPGAVPPSPPRERWDARRRFLALPAVAAPRRRLDERAPESGMWRC